MPGAAVTAARRNALIAAVAIATAHEVGAQRGSARELFAVSGIVIDAASQRPPIRTRVCAIIRSPTELDFRCSEVDSTGAYRIDSLPRATLLSVQCNAIREFDGKAVSSDSIRFDGASERRDWVVSTVGCDKRPIRQIRGAFRGHYNAAFEGFAFVPCPADAWFLPGDSLESFRVVEKYANPVWSERLARELKWPDVKPDSYGVRRYYAHWQGTITGPLNNIVGQAPFQFRVDSMLEFRAPRGNDCR